MEEEAAVRKALPDPQPPRHTSSTGRTPERNARLHWPTVLFGALPASYLALPAAAGILFGGFFALSLRPLGLVILVAGALGWVGTISLWAAAGSRGAFGRRTARGLALGIVGAVLFALIKLSNHDLGDRLALFPVILVLGPVWIAVWHLVRSRSSFSSRPAAQRAALSAPPSDMDRRRQLWQRALEAMVFVEVIAGLLLVPVVAADTAGWSSFAVTFSTFPVVLAFLVTAGYCSWKYPALRVWAALVVIVPVVVPVVIWSANRAVGIEATRRASLLAAVLIPAAILVLLPHRVARFLPRFAVESRGFHVALVAVLALAVVPWPVALLLRPQVTGTATQLGAALLTGHAALAGGLAAVALAFGYTALFAKRERRSVGLNIAQIVLALIVLGLALPTVWLAFLAFGAATVG